MACLAADGLLVAILRETAGWADLGEPQARRASKLWRALLLTVGCCGQLLEALMLRSARHSRPALQRAKFAYQAARAVAVLCHAGLALGTASASSADGGTSRHWVAAAGGAGPHPEQLLGVIAQQAGALKAAFQQAGLGELLAGLQPISPVHPAAALRLCVSSLRLAAAGAAGGQPAGTGTDSGCQVVRLPGLCQPGLEPGPSCRQGRGAPQVQVGKGCSTRELRSCWFEARGTVP